MGRGWPVGFVLAVLGCGRIGFDAVGGGVASDANTNPPPDGFGPAATGCGPLPPTGSVVYVATTGDDNSGDGTMGSPYRTIQRTYDRVAPGTTILVQPGVYATPLDLTRTVSPERIAIAAVTPYTVTVEDLSQPLSCSGCTGLVLDGLYVHATGSGGLPVLHINGGQDVVIRNCIVDNSGSSATIRLSGDPVNVTVLRNMVFDGNPPLHAAQITDVSIVDNLVVHTRMLNGPLMWLESPLGGTSRIQRNILAGFRGCIDCGMLEMRLDTGTRVESNLLVSSTAQSDGAFKLEGPIDATIQFNTVVGDVPGTAFALTGTEYNATPVSSLILRNNVFADPTGTLGDFSDGTTTDIPSPVLMSNAYWNNGAAMPPGVNDSVDWTNDPQAVLADPELPSFAAFTPPVWDAANHQFADGSKTICDEFYRIALSYGMPAAGSPLVGAATGPDRPLDLLGFARTKGAIGALEPQ
ncbi:MAG TPA: hypothetical protein VFV99_07000 [Kofleriaceae bacterium]|nr:hypothetical protein [Kofleriaceae bacterium]